MKFPSFLPPLRGRFLAAAAMFAALGAAPSLADSLPSPSGATFSYGSILTVAGYDAARPALADFPILVRISAGSPSGFAYSQLQSPSTGADLAFLDMDGNGLPFEIDTWNTSGESLVWVRLPSMRNGTRFAMCWGSETSGKALCSDNPWDDYVGVWHMNEDAAGVTTIHDSTTNSLDGTTVDSSTSKTDGKVGRARLITTNTTNTAGKPYDSGVTIDMTGNAAKLDVVNGIVPEFTASFWVRPQSNANWWYFITRKASDVGPGWGLQQGANGDFTKYRAYGGVETDSNCKSFSGVNGLSQGTWTKIDAVWKTDKTFVLYMNGVQAASGTLVNQATNGDQTKLSLGGAMAPTDTSKKNGRGVYGDMDEIRLRKGVLSPDWIAADYATQFDPAFLTIGAAEEIDPSAPAATLSVTGESFTGAVARVRVFALGDGASTATACVEVSATQDFAAPIWSGEAEVAAAGTVDIPATGLAFGTDYWVRGTVTNAVGGSVALGPVAFTTLTPGAPEGEAEFVERGYSTLSALGVVTGLGDGATSATVRLEASTNAFATVAAASPAVPASLSTENTIAVSNLVPGVEYRLRFRFENDWGVESFVPVAGPESSESIATLEGPVDASDIRWTFSADFTSVDVFLDVDRVLDGATGSATLFCDEADEPTTPRGDRTVSEPGTLAWAAIPFDDTALHAKIVIETEAGGTAYTQMCAAVVDHNFKARRPVRLTGVTPDGDVDNPNLVFDGNLQTGISATTGGCVIGDFTGSSMLDNGQVMYVSRIDVTHLGDSRYSLYTSVDGTDWTVVPTAANVQYAGTASYPVSKVANYIKCVFESSMGNNICLYEIDAYGYAKAEPKVVSRWQIASFHNADGTAMTANGGGGNNWGGADRSAQRLFDNNFTSYQMWPKAGNNGYVVVDFTKNDGTSALQEYFVEELWVGANGTKKFTLQYSEDGTTWEDVEGAVAITCEEIGKFKVGKIAKKVRYVWVDGSYNNFSDEYLAEFQVWGIDPDDAPCTHPSYTEWVVGAIPATCTGPAKDQRMCTACGERFTRDSPGSAALGHDYVSTLVHAGRVSTHKDFPDHRQYGTGSITCSRCSFRLDFPTALDLVTNKVGGIAIGGMKTAGIFRFTDVSVSSENHPEWGPGGKKIIDGVWNTSQEWPYWASTSPNGQYADFEFGTTIDLTAVELSVYNHAYDFEICDVDDATGTETAFCAFSVIKDETASEGKSVPLEMVDPKTGKIHEVEVWKKVTADYQRLLIPLFETPIQHLRVRITDGEPEELWGCRIARVIEIHPWGTVAGASDYLSEKTTIMILR